MSASKPRVLLVEDEEAVRLLLRLTLELGAVEIVEAPDGEMALELCSEQPPELIFLDWSMPGMSGVEVCRELRSRPETRETPIVMLTAHSSDSEREQGLAAGADDYIAKPFSPETLLDKLRSQLGTDVLLGEA